MTGWKYPATVLFIALDEIDSVILRILRDDGRISYRSLGNRVGLSANAAAARVGRLIERGVITGFRAEIDHAALGRPIEGKVDIRLRDPDRREPLHALVARDDRIVDAYHLTGPIDFRLTVVVASTTDLDDLLTRLRNEGEVAETDTRLVLHRIAT